MSDDLLSVPVQDHGETGFVDLDFRLARLGTRADGMQLIEAVRRHVVTMKATERQQLIEIVQGTPWLMGALEAVRSVGPPAACIGAGAVRAAVWDVLHERTVPSALADVDVPYFEPADLSPEREGAYRAELTARAPAIVWDVVNQAAVHLWYERRFGMAIAPLRSMEDAIASWPETATAVGLSMNDSGGIRVIAPYGLSDLFGCVVRSTRRVSDDQFKARVEAKRWSERWPKVRVVWP